MVMHSACQGPTSVQTVPSLPVLLLHLLLPPGPAPPPIQAISGLSSDLIEKSRELCITGRKVVPCARQLLLAIQVLLLALFQPQAS